MDLDERLEDESGILKPNDIEALKRAFNKYDKKKNGTIKPTELADVFRMAGQNPTLEEAEKINAEADEPGTGMCMFSDIVPIVEKYWKNYENYADELRQACLAFDRQDMGVMDFQELKAILIKYGDLLDEDEIDLFEKSVNVNDGKIIVDEFIKTLSPIVEEPKKAKKGGGGAGGKKKGK